MIKLTSFGYKLHGPPKDADLIFDARTIQNPIRRFAGTGKTGLDAEVRDYVLGTSVEAQMLVAAVVHAILEDGIRHVAIGCMWGHHRSVSVAEAAGRYIGTITGTMPEIVHLELTPVCYDKEFSKT